MKADADHAHMAREGRLPHEGLSMEPASNQNTPTPRNPLSWFEPARRGDAAALERAMEPFRRYLMVIADRVIDPALATRVDPSDLVQETFLIAQRKLASFRGSTDSEWRAWLKTIMLNHLMNLRRSFPDSRNRGLIVSLSDDLVGSGGASRKPSSTPSQFIRLKERDQAIDAALSLLPEHYRAVVRWRSVDRLSFDEIGTRLNVSADAARKVWARALPILKQSLGSDYDPG